MARPAKVFLADQSARNAEIAVSVDRKRQYRL
jgi:hypothetical protein